jgi:cellulose synthase/poly-beta-1,6-N-acetylglucosamine synthase-like glycosyltransferase
VFILLFFQILILLYFMAMNCFFALSFYIAAKELSKTLSQGDDLTARHLLEETFYKPISILVPAYNEEATITASLSSFLNLHYPEYEVVVVNDGSKDNTVAVLIEAFALVPVNAFGCQAIATQNVRGVYRSKLYSNLLVIDKENGGKADALNAATNYSRFPLVCAVDADSMLDAKALLRSARAFVEDDTLIATGGTIRALNNSDTASGEVLTLRAPQFWLERFQVVEYVRAFLSGRSTFSHYNLLLIISGAFGIFRRDVVLELGGYRTDTVGEDMELVVRMHRWAREQKRPYRILYTADPVCWTQVPSDLKTLRKQRNRWQRGLWETLYNHRDLLFNPRYGRIGMVAIPFFWLFEALAPVIELSGVLYMLVLLIFQGLNWPFAALFLALAFFCGLLTSLTAFCLEVFMHTHYPTLADRRKLFFASILENFGYRQIIVYERFIASFQVWRKRGQWGEMKRQKIKN